MMERQLRTKELTVQTAQVTIQALKVGPRQVTMGLFRQLPYADLIDPESLQLRGVPWGHVRYWWDGDGGPASVGERLHVVWQNGDELCRTVVTSDPPVLGLRGLDTRERRAIKRCILAWADSADAYVITPAMFPPHLWRAVVNGQEFQVALTETEAEVLRHYWRVRQTGRELAQEVPDYQDLLRKQEILGVPITTLQEAVNDIRQQRQRYSAQWRKQWETLQTLPQLFIAV